MVDEFKEKYGVECFVALHHNKRKTNLHIHMVFAERKRLEQPIEKVATRNMFYDEQGHHVRTKKEILDGDGSIRKGCKIIKKGEVYEHRIFTIKDGRVWGYCHDGGNVAGAFAYKKYAKDNGFCGKSR